MGAEQGGVRGTGRAGFTLIEVMVAMLVLAVGLLGVQALLVSGARSVARAADLSELAEAASAAMETEQRAILARTSDAGGEERCHTGSVSGVRVCVLAEAGAPLPTGLARVTVRAVHPRAAADTLTIVTHVFAPPAR